jgi:SanA protein
MRCLAKLFLLALFLLAIGVFALCQLYVSYAASGKIFASADAIPARDIGLVLGTSEHLSGGGPNPYFKNRIDAAAELFKKGKIRHLIVSGDNREHNYNEPADMRRALVARGVPDRAITSDFAGLRTFDSVVRAKEIFGVEKLTIISQRAHDERALLIAGHYDIDAIAFAAKDATKEIPLRYAVRNHIREWGARVLAIADLYIFHTHPKHLGPKIKLPIGQ